MDLFISATFFQFKFRFAGSYYASCNKPHDQTLKQICLLSQMFLPNKISEEHLKAEKQCAEVQKALTFECLERIFFSVLEKSK